jgi:putative SOS response-associated peptidase YedK
MCGRYTAAKNFNELIKLVGVVMSRVPFFAPRYNIAPTQLAPVIFNERHQPGVKLMRWGLIPSWAKDESVGNALINARSETLQSRNAFRVAFKKRRCLIPADSFYEWQQREGKRQPFRVMLKSGEPFCFAGLWERWIKPPAAGKFDTDLDEAPASETIESFTIITRAASAAIAPLHDRMPVIMAPNHFGWWLKDDGERGESHKMALGYLRRAGDGDGAFAGWRGLSAQHALRTVHQCAGADADIPANSRCADRADAQFAAPKAGR